MKQFFQNFHLSFHAFLGYLPALAGAIAFFIITIFAANLLSKLVAKYTKHRTHDALISNFIAKIIWAVIFIFGTVITLGILGLGTISDKILAGAGITTFIVGFALKDIGENFLSGLLLAFSRPFRVDSLIEVDGIKGVVKDMTLRQTTVEAENGKIILIPNSKIITNALTLYTTNNDYHLRQEFFIQVDQANAREAAKLISQTIAKFDYVMQAPEKPIRTMVDSYAGDKVKFQVVYWFDTTKLTAPESEKKSEIMFAVSDAMRGAGYRFTG